MLGGYSIRMGARTQDEVTREGLMALRLVRSWSRARVLAYAEHLAPEPWMRQALSEDRDGLAEVRLITLRRDRRGRSWPASEVSVVRPAQGPSPEKRACLLVYPDERGTVRVVLARPGPPS